MQKSNQFFKVLNQFDSNLQRAKSQLNDVRLFYEMGQVEYACDMALDMEETMEKAVFADCIRKVSASC